MHTAHRVAVCVFLRAITEWIFNVPHEAIPLFAFHFQIAHCRLQHRVPVHQPLAPVDQALFVQFHKRRCHHGGHLRIHGEVLMLPGHRIPHTPHLLGNGRARLFLPFPHFGDKIFASQVVARLASSLQLSLDHNLRRNAGVVGAWHPQRVVATHAVVARQAVHDGLVKRMTHVQRARHIRRRQLDGKRWLGDIKGRLIHATLLPQRTKMRLNCCGFKRLGEAVKARGGWGCGCRDGGEVGHSGIKNGIETMPLCSSGVDCNFIRLLLAVPMLLFQELLAQVSIELKALIKQVF